MCEIVRIVQTPFSIRRFVHDQASDGSPARAADVARIQNCWRKHPSSRRDHSRLLWAVLMMQSWLEATVGYGASRMADIP
jgi:hypothetical protein